MRVFAINLAQRTDKRERLLGECQQHHIAVEIVDAVDGRQLSAQELLQLAYDYPQSGLTLGEIGCALSHLAIYKRMIDENCPLAMVLEDDIVLKPGINAVMNAIEEREKTNHAPQIYLLSPSHFYLETFKKPLCPGYFVHRIADAYYGYAYIINQPAAKALYNFLRPVAYEADRWGYFQQLGLARVDCIVPPVVGTFDQKKTASDLESDRKPLILKRAAYYRAQRKQMPLVKKLKKTFWKAIGIHFVKVVRQKLD